MGNFCVEPAARISCFIHQSEDGSLVGPPGFVPKPRDSYQRITRTSLPASPSPAQATETASNPQSDKHLRPAREFCVRLRLLALVWVD